MKKEYIINWQGNDFVKYEGLLDEAHQQGLSRISTTLIQIPHEDNGNVAVVAAEVETSKGTFSSIGAASAANARAMAAHEYVRIAEDRAKARALRDAVNLALAPLEEIEHVEAPREEPERSGVRTAREGGDGYRADAPKASPFKPASANQLATIAKLSRLLGYPGDVPEDMTSAQASERITELSREYNERKGAGQRSA